MKMTFPMFRTMAQYPPIRAAMRELFDGHQCAELPDFLFAVADYRRSPSLAGAQDVATTYVTVDSPRTVNLSNDDRQQTEAAVAALVPAAFATNNAAIYQVFDHAVTAVLDLINMAAVEQGFDAELDQFLDTHRISG